MSLPDSSPPRSNRRAAIEAALESADAGARVTDRSGRVIYENGPMERIVASDPDRRLLEQAMTDARLAAQSRPRLRRATAVASPPVIVSCRTAAAEYRIRALPVRRGIDGVVIWLRRRSTRRPPAAMLRERFGLTPREARVASLLEAGLRSRELAGVLGISVHTARRHSEAVLRKLGVHSRREIRARLQS